LGALEGREEVWDLALSPSSIAALVDPEAPEAPPVGASDRIASLRLRGVRRGLLPAKLPPPPPPTEAAAPPPRQGGGERLVLPLADTDADAADADGDGLVVLLLPAPMLLAEWLLASPGTDDEAAMVPAAFRLDIDEWPKFPSEDEPKACLAWRCLCLAQASCRCKSRSAILKRALPEGGPTSSSSS